MQENPFVEQDIADPVLSNARLPLRRTFYPFGHPLDLETNSEEVIQAAEEGWGGFAQAFDAAPVRLALGVMEGDPEALPLRSVVRSRGYLMSIVANADNFAVCDFEQGFAFGWVTPEVAADHSLLRYRFLTAAGATLIEQRSLASLHGALIARNGVGVALCGDSFAGKSTLAYACARAGWTLISDDGTFLVRGRKDRYAVGDFHTIRFRADAPSLFPELVERMPVIRPNGKIGIEVFTSELPIATAAGCTVDHLVFLDRHHPGPAKLCRCGKERARQAWEAHAIFGAEETRVAQQQCYLRLLDAGLWEMDYSGLDGAVARLERLVDCGG
ncbi:MAG TPA: hypothetical protein VMH80_02465 [Bryobacteraceae bacterium]|nr:hypothetical protein [Bryobacteraceae bacterium]